MSPANFAAIDWENQKPTHAIYLGRLFEIGSHGKREQLLALRGVYPKQPATFLTWVRCENAEICEEPHLKSPCCDSPVTTIRNDNHPTYHHCGYCLQPTLPTGDPQDPKTSLP